VSTRLIEQLATLASVGTEERPYALSADGHSVAFEWYRDGNWQVYLLDLDGGELRRVGQMADACRCPLFSSDGRHLYFARDDRGSERFDIYRYDLASGLHENLMPETPDLAPLPDFGLSPDGTRLAMMITRDAGYSTAVMPAAVCPRGDAILPLSQHASTEGSPLWSPDGRLLAVAVATRGQDAAVFLVDPTEGLRSVVGGSDAFVARHPAWAPDGRRLAFTGAPDDHSAIGVVDLDTGSIAWAWQGKLDAHHPAWSPDGAALAFLVDCEGETGLCHLDLRTRVATEYSIGSGNHYAPSFSADGSALFCVLSAPDHPPALYRVALEDRRVARLTESLPPALQRHAFVDAAPIRYTSRDHLAEVPGLLAEPAQPNGAGVVIVHGGPTWHHSNEWDPLRQALVAAGVTVLHPNYRGSDGYGRRWQLANRWLMGQGEVLDVVAAYDCLVDSGCDPRRIAITGRSWGGFLTMAALTQFPGLWAAGVAGVPFFDFIDGQLDPLVREDLRWWDRENTGDITKDRAKLEHYSPINHLDAVEAPLLLLAGALDPRCPPRQVHEVAERLQARGKTCDYVVYENEGHSLSGFRSRIDSDRRAVEFILRHTGAV